MLRTLCAVALAAVVGLVYAGAASAQTWRDCNPTHAGGQAKSLNLNTSVCYDYADTTDSAIIPVPDTCDNVDVWFFPDFDGTNTDSTAQILVCGYSQGTLANICWVAEDKTLDGVASTDTEAIVGIAAPYLAVNPVANASTRKSRVWVRCNGR